jgi:hypothetical protein
MICSSRRERALLSPILCAFLSSAWLLGTVACTPAPIDRPPTAVLLVPTAAPSPSSLTPIATHADLLNPSDLVLVPSPTVWEAILPSAAVAGDELEELRQLLSRVLMVEVSAVRWVKAEAARWRFASTRCHSPDAQGSVLGKRVFFLVGMTVYEFQQQGAGQYRLCRATSQARDALLLAVDPVAAELVRLAQQRVAAQLDLPVRRVSWVQVEAYRWWDTSLGCPAAGQTYSPIDVPGYRIVLQAGDELYAFHTDAERLFPCALGAEVLTPPPTPTAPPIDSTAQAG